MGNKGKQAQQPQAPKIPDFTGKWNLERTELLEEYMKQSLGKSEPWLP